MAFNRDFKLKYFPYKSCREKQLKLIKAAWENILEKRHLIVQAPAGFGKTICTLTGALEAIEDKKLKILWICRTHREADRVIEEVEKIYSVNQNVSAITIRARSELCPMPIDHEARGDAESFSILCSEIKNEISAHTTMKKLMKSFSQPLDQ